MTDQWPEQQTKIRRPLSTALWADIQSFTHYHFNSNHNNINPDEKGDLDETNQLEGNLGSLK